MAKERSAFFCAQCGHEAQRWLGRCPACEAWNSFAEAPSPRRRSGGLAAVPAAAATAGRLGDVGADEAPRIATGWPEFDALLGGGIVPGSVVLVGGPPGTGKSTLLLQMAGTLAAAGGVVYVTGEESAAQTKLRATRLGVSDETLLLAETDLDNVLGNLERLRPRVAVIDSIQTMAQRDTESYAGSVAQVRDCAARVVEFAKRTGCAAFLVGHVTKDGAIAGPRMLEHVVDTVLYFEGDGGEHRVLRAHKNRFGNAEEICVFAMDGEGLHEVSNPSQLFLGAANAREQRPSGSCIVAAVVGTRPLLVEVQALVAETNYGTPRRLAANLDAARLAMILAVLERRAGMSLGAFDVYASVAGGLRVDEPATDLGVALAIASAFRGRALAPDVVAFGELGLSGEVRPVGAHARRVAEARRLGFGTILAPAVGAGGAIAGVRTVRDVAAAIAAAVG